VAGPVNLMDTSLIQSGRVNGMFASNPRPILTLLCIPLILAFGPLSFSQEKSADAPANAAQDATAQEKSAQEKAAHEKAAHEESAEKKAAVGHSDSAASPENADPAAAAAHATSGSSGSQGHGGHHDTTDLSHQNSTPGLTEPLDWRSDSAIATLLIFLCLLALLSKFAWRPVMDGLEAREQGIAAKIDEATRSAERAADQLRQYEARLAAATEEARGILDQARRDAETAKARIVAEAQEVAQRERQRAIDDIAVAKNVALQEMTQKSVDLAVSLAGRIIRKQLRPEDHAQLIREMVDQFPSRN
jgi:F-type H+-transporting ATPase subunit b